MAELNGERNHNPTTIWVSDVLIDEIDDQRHSKTSRSRWFREAALARIIAEQSGEWTTPNDDVDVLDL